jgi:hypothetical protein
MSEHEGGDNKFLTGLLIGIVIGLLLGGGAGGLMLMRNSQVMTERDQVLAVVREDAEARGKERAQELDKANQRIKELEAKLAEKKP